MFKAQLNPLVTQSPQERMNRIAAEEALSEAADLLEFKKNWPRPEYKALLGGITVTALSALCGSPLFSVPAGIGTVALFGVKFAYPKIVKNEDYQREGWISEDELHEPERAKKAISHAKKLFETYSASCPPYTLHIPPSPKSKEDPALIRSQKVVQHASDFSLPAKVEKEANQYRFLVARYTELLERYAVGANDLIESSGPSKNNTLGNELLSIKLGNELLSTKAELVYLRCIMEDPRRFNKRNDFISDLKSRNVERLEADSVEDIAKASDYRWTDSKGKRLFQSK